MGRRYRANWSYRAGLVAFAEGDVVELDDDVATHVTVNDSPGVLTPVDDAAAPAPEPEPEPSEAVPEPTRRGGRRGS